MKNAARRAWKADVAMAKEKKGEVVVIQLDYEKALQSPAVTDGNYRYKKMTTWNCGRVTKHIFFYHI